MNFRKDYDDIMNDLYKEKYYTQIKNYIGKIISRFKKYSK